MLRYALLILTALVAASQSATSARAEKRVALVIGNASYQQGRLAGSRNDANLMAEVLRERGFALVDGGALLDLDKRAFDRAIVKFTDQLRGADVGLFYYSGHALNVNGTNYLVPVSLDPMSSLALADATIDASALLGRMQGAGARLKLMLLEASRDNPFGGNFRATSHGLARIEPPPDTILSFAAQPEHVSEGRNSEHGVFTQALADTIRKPGLSAFNLFSEVDRAVQLPTGGVQRPWVMINSPAAGRFSFAPVADEGATVSTAVAPSPLPAPPPTTPPASATSPPQRAAAPPVTSTPPPRRATAPEPLSSQKRPPPRQQPAEKKKTPETKQAAVPNPSPKPAPAASGGRCRSIQALCALEIGGCCNQATGHWQYGRNGCGGTVMAHNNCLSRRLAGQK
jgi:hypothetical protein